VFPASPVSAPFIPGPVQAGQLATVYPVSILKPTIYDLGPPFSLSTEAIEPKNYVCLAMKIKQTSQYISSDMPFR